ncbi:MAG: glycosyltransferase family 4 protein [Chlorobi bacterium]|nr:glycosyltransferase family 4 protein [Chlorobiota bacterium]
MKIFINGKDGKGWAVDTTRNDIEKALLRLNIKQTGNIISADIIHNVWWNYFLTKTSFPLRFKKNIILFASNFIDPENENFFLKNEFSKANKYATAWIAPSTKQKKILEKHSENVFHMPYYLNFDLFKIKKNTNKAEILKKYKIPKNLFDDKVIIGSFQRDSLGTDLNKPKWQKNPDLIIELLKDLPKDKFILFLSGPRRHYIINRCKKINIPFYYLGKETYSDDININALSYDKMPDLYRITDLYLITSKSEGGPKAIQEATSLKTNIFSTDAGLASDFLLEKNIFRDTESYKKAVFNFVVNFDKNKNTRIKDTEKQYEICTNLSNPDILDKKLEKIYEHLLKQN